MNSYIANSTASFPLGRAGGRKCFRVKDGQYANRMAILFASSANAISLVWTDAPYTVFSSPQTIISDAADSPFDAVMSDDGTIYLAYSVGTELSLGFARIDFANGQWQANTPVTVCDADENYFPSIINAGDGHLAVAFTRLSSGDRFINIKESSDGGQNWGTISDPGTTLTAGASAAFSRLVVNNGMLYTFYTEAGSRIAFRRRLVSGSTWESESVLATGSGFGEHFSIALNYDGRIGVVYVTASGLACREYSGSAWSAVYSIDSGECQYPSISYQSGICYIIYNRPLAGGMSHTLYARQVDSGFSSPQPLDSRRSFLTKVLVYDESAGSLLDRTAEAASEATADIIHPNIGGMMQRAGDSAFFGMSNPFSFLRVILSTAGSGGEILWRYFNGQTWIAFTPFSGAFHFTTTDYDLLLWKDFQSIPLDWQKKVIDSQSLYWVAATVTTDFSSAPVGSRITAIPDLTMLSQQV